MTATTSGLVLTRDEAATILRGLRFRVDTTRQLRQAVEVFQDSFRLAPAPLRVDGVVGPVTTSALALAEDRLRRRQSTMSAHFSYAEVACHCRLAYRDCRGVLVDGALVDALEQLRAHFYPHGMAIASAYRCPGKNEVTAGAADDSQHQHGTAADITRAVPTARVQALALFSGIGSGADSHLVRHVDVRHAGSSNPTASTPHHPALWTYAHC